MAETNSEKKATWVAIVGVVFAGIGAVAAEILTAGLVDQWPIAVTVLGVVVSIATMVTGYTLSRPGKHLAMAQELLADKAAASADPSSASKD